MFEFLKRRPEEISPHDYQIDNLWHCHVCSKPKEALADLGQTDEEGNPKPVALAIACTCESLANKQWRAEEEKRKKIERISELRKYGLRSPSDQNSNFKVDEEPESKISKYCRSYAKNFQKALDGNLGLLFHGNSGTGKTFYALCIANELIEEQQRMVLVTSLSDCIRILQYGDLSDQNQLKRKIEKAKLVVFDDIGAERKTEYALEQIHTILDIRANSGLPTIGTTNYSLEELRSTESREFTRLYDRIIKMCSIPIKMVGESKRRNEVEKKRNLAIEVLELGGD